MEALIGLAIILAILAGIIYGLYLLCALIWNTTVCWCGWLDATFSILLIIVVIVGVIGIALLIIGLAGESDGCVTAVVKFIIPGIIVMGALAGLIAAYGMVELALFDGLPAEFIDLENPTDRVPALPVTFSPGGTMGQITASVTLIGIILGVMGMVASIFFCIYTEHFTLRYFLAAFVPAAIFSVALFGWSVIIVDYVWDYPTFDAVIHGIGVSAGFLSVAAALICLCLKGADAINGGGVAAGFCLGLGAALSLLAYMVFGAKILVDLMSEYYLWIILGFVGLYLVLGIVYCLTRLHKIKEFISDGIYYYWHK